MVWRTIPHGASRPWSSCTQVTPLAGDHSASIIDEHYGVGAQRPVCPVRVKTPTRRISGASRPLAESFLRAAGGSLGVQVISTRGGMSRISGWFQANREVAAEAEGWSKAGLPWTRHCDNSSGTSSGDRAGRRSPGERWRRGL